MTWSKEGWCISSSSTPSRHAAQARSDPSKSSSTHRLPMRSETPGRRPGQLVLATATIRLPKGDEGQPPLTETSIDNEVTRDNPADVREPGPRALDLRGLGTRRLQLGRLGAPRDRVRGGRWTRTGELDGRGRDGRGLAQRLSAWEDFRTEAEEYRELDDERVLVLARWSGRGKTSGVSSGRCETRAASLFHDPRRQGDRGSSSTATASARSPTSASHRTPAPDPYSARPAARNASL